MAQYYEFADFKKLRNQIHDNEQVSTFEVNDIDPEITFVSHFMSMFTDTANKTNTEAACVVHIDEALPYTYVTTPLFVQSYLKKHKQPMEDNTPQLHNFSALEYGLIPASLIYATAKGIQGLPGHVKEALGRRMADNYVSYDYMVKRNLGILVAGKEIQDVFPGRVAEVQGT